MRTEGEDVRLLDIILVGLFLWLLGTFVLGSLTIGAFRLAGVHVAYWVVYLVWSLIIIVGTFVFERPTRLPKGLENQ